MSNNIQIVCPGCQAVNRVPADRTSQSPKCGRCKSQLLTGAPLEINDLKFNKLVEKNTLPVVVDFWAEWCGPCQMMAPSFTAAAAELKTNAVFAKVNTEQAQQASARFAIRSIPTMVIFKEGKEIARQSGAMNKDQIIQWVKSVI